MLIVVVAIERLTIKNNYKKCLTLKRYSDIIKKLIDLVSKNKMVDL
jgi:hypothetical protein